MLFPSKTTGKSKLLEKFIEFISQSVSLLKILICSFKHDLKYSKYSWKTFYGNN